MKTKKSDLLQLWRVFEILGNGKQKIKFSYFIAKNKSKIKDEIEILNKLLVPSERFQAYDQKRAAVAQEFSDKDESGKPIIVDQNYVITEKKEQFDSAIKQLREENKDVIAEFERQKKEYEDILKEESDFVGHQIKMEDLPDQIEPQLLELFIRTGLLAE